MLINNTNNTVMKKYKGRSGGLLILVVLILAVAMVLITSALMMTVASRDRYYNNALTSQASLTAASVAKTIASAAEIGDLSKADLDQLVILTQNNPVIVTKTTVAGTLSISPGLEGVKDNSGNTKTSYTDLLVEYSNIAKTNFKITVNTYLDAGSATNKSQQTVTIYLAVNNPVYPEGFGATLNVFGDTPIPNVNIGTNAPPNPKSNFVTFTGNVTENVGQTIFAGDVIITEQVKINANPMLVKGNLVLYGPNAGIFSSGSSQGLPTVSLTSYFLDLCESGTRNTFWNEPTDNGNYITTGPIFKPAGIIIDNTSMKLTTGNDSAKNFLPGNKIIYTLGSGSVTLNANPVDPSGYNGQFTVQALPAGNVALNSLVTKYTSDSGAVQKSLAFEPPADRAALMDLLGLPEFKGVTGTAAIVNKLKLEKDAKWIVIQNPGTIKTYNNDGTTSTSQTLTAPAYYLNTSISPDVIKGPITFDLTNNDIDLFLVGNGTTNMTNQQASIRFVRPLGSTHIGRIIFMEDDAMIDLNNSAGNVKDYPGITGAGDPSRYTKNGELITDGSEPYLYIYGYDNGIKANTSSFVEGYYGLFGKGYFEVPGGNNKLTNTYARFTVYEMRMTSGNLVEIVYCPGPGEGSTSVAPNINPYVISGYITS